MESGFFYVMKALNFGPRKSVGDGEAQNRAVSPC